MNNERSTMQNVTTPVEGSGSFLGHLYTSVAATVVLVALCCGIYPLLVWGIAQAAFPDRANGSLVDKDGHLTSNADAAVGSALLAQNFTAPKYFHPRPSAAGAGYDGTSSGGTNLGPLSDKLLNGIHGSKNADSTPNPSADFDGIADLAKAYRTDNGLTSDAQVPADAVTRSASGLDPHVSPANAECQIARVAKARGLSEADVRTAVARATAGPALGILGDPGVNVLELNLALDSQATK